MDRPGKNIDINGANLNFLYDCFFKDEILLTNECYILYFWFYIHQNKLLLEKLKWIWTIEIMSEWSRLLWETHCFSLWWAWNVIPIH